MRRAIGGRMALVVVGVVLSAAPSAMGQVVWSPGDGRTPTLVQDPRGVMAVTDGGSIPRIQLMSARQSRAVLSRVRSRASRGSCVWRDADFVLRLANRYLRRGQPRARRLTVLRTLRVNAWWYSRSRPQPGRGTTIREPDGVLSTYWECRGFGVNPVATTGRWLKLNSDVTDLQLARAMLSLGVPRRSGTFRFRVWEYYDVPDNPGLIRPGTSGMAQGRVAALFGRGYRATGSKSYLASAALAMRAFAVSVPRGGARQLLAYPIGTRPSPWFVERAFPGHGNPWRGAALNGFMVSILNLKSISGYLSSTPPTGALPNAKKWASMADLLAEQGSVTLRRYLPLHDSGSWSYYGMLPTGYPWRSYLAPLNYHCYHLRLLDLLNGNFPGEGYDAWRDKWTGYLTQSGQTCPT